MKHYFFFLCALGIMAAEQATAQITWQRMQAPLQNITDVAEGPGGLLFASSYTGLYRYLPAAPNWQKLDIPNNIVMSLLFSSKNELLAATGGLQVYRSTDNGDSWTKILDSNDGDQYRFWTLAEGKDGRLYVAASQYKGVMVSANNGQDWQDMSNGLGDENSHVNHFIVDVTGRLLLSTEVNGLFWYDTAATAWKNYPIPRGSGLHSPISNAVTHPGGNILASGANGGYISTNNGASWISIFNGNARLCLLSDGRLLIVGGSQVFVSQNGGLNWTDASAGAAALGTVRGVEAGRNGAFYIATNTDVVKGSFITSGLDEDRRENSLSVYPNPSADEFAFSFRLDSDSNIELTVCDAMGRRMAELAGGPAAPGEYRFVWNAAGYPAGVYYYSLRSGGTQRHAKLIKQ